MSEQYTITKDGNKWFCATEGFINLQESPVVWGDSPLEAFTNCWVAELTKEARDEGFANGYAGQEQ